MTAAEVGRTGRGLLLREGDRLVRVLDPRLCDERFRTAQAGLRGRRPPGTLEIVAEGPARDGYRIEYAAPADDYRTLGEAMAEAGHWHRRLRLAMRVCDALADWYRGRLATLGLDPHGVLVTGAGDDLRVWLAPCPPVRFATPRDLFGLDVASLAALAPEVVRGLAPQQRTEDAYALGTLAALALGCRPAATAGAADRIERQARDALLAVSAAGSEVEPALAGAARVATLVRVIRLYRNHAADARPPDATELRRALGAAAALEEVAADLWADGDPAAALEALAHTGWPLSAHWLAGRVHAAGGDPAAAFGHYAEAVRQAPTQFKLRQQRLDDLFPLWTADPDASPEWAAAFLDDLAQLQRFSGPDDGPDLWLLEAAVHERAKDDGRLAAALHAAAGRAPNRLDVLYRYGEALRRLGAAAEVEQVKALARHRIATMARISRLGEEAAGWEEPFDEL